MRFVNIDDIRPGEKNGLGIYKNGRLILSKDTILTETLIKRLKAYGYNGLYLTDKFSQNIEIKAPVDQTVSQNIVCNLKELFKRRPDSGVNDKVKEQALLNTLSENLLTELVESVCAQEDIHVNMIDLKNYDDYTYCHSLNVAILSTIVGKTIGMDKEMLKNIAIAGLLHDIGKREIDPAIIRKPGKLSHAEMELIKEHPIKSYLFVKENMPYVSATVLSGIYQHHEREDGSGYPDGIYGSKISKFGKILAAVDVYDAFTSKRPYHGARLPSEGIEYLYATQNLDMSIIEAFLRSVYAYPNGTLVQLSNGVRGIVIAQNNENVCRPVIKNLENDEQIVLLDNLYSSVTITGILKEAEIDDLK